MSWLYKLFPFLRPAPPRPPEPTAGETFDSWFNRQGFHHFTGGEIARYFYRSKRNHTTGELAHNGEPPREIWVNVLPTMRLVDDLRRALGRPVRVTSSYRNKPYNDACGSTDGSLHRVFNALDIQADGATPHEVWSILKAWRKAGRFEGGLGLYPSFVHVDTRGYNADW